MRSHTIHKMGESTQLPFLPKLIYWFNIFTTKISKYFVDIVKTVLYGKVKIP